MKTSLKAYKKLWRLVARDEIHLRTSDFAAVCRRIGSPQAELDTLLMEELGYTGSEMLRELRHRHFDPCRRAGNYLHL